MADKSEVARVGGLAAVVLGVAVFIFFPTLGLVEVLIGVWVLTTRLAWIGLIAVLPSVLVLAYAVQGMVGSNRSDYRVSIPLAIIAVATVALLIRGSAVGRSAGAREH